MYVGLDVCQPLHLKASDKVKFFIEKNNSRIWKIKKAWDDCGYTLFDSNRNKATARYLKVQITWRFFEPMPSEMRLHQVPHEFLEESLLVRLCQ